MRAGLLGMFAVIVLGCGGSSGDRTTQTCGRVFDAACTALVRCRAEAQPGVPFTAALCQQARTDVVSDCVMEDDPTAAAASDAQINACVQGYADFACADLCDQIPVDPAACRALYPMEPPGTDVITCAP